MNKIAMAGFLSVCLFTGCVGPKMKTEFEASLKQWEGRPVAELLAQYLSDKSQQITIYEKRGGGQFYTIQSWKNYEDVNPGRNKYVLPCFKIFETDAKGLIVSARYEGTGCW